MFVNDYRKVSYISDADRARKHGLDEFVQANPDKFDHADLFKTLQVLTLDYRLNDAYTCLVSTQSHPYTLLIPLWATQGLHIVHFKGCHTYHDTPFFFLFLFYDTLVRILNAYQQYILFDFKPQTLIYTLISWDFRKFNTPNTMKYPN